MSIYVAAIQVYVSGQTDFLISCGLTANEKNLFSTMWSMPLYTITTIVVIINATSTYMLSEPLLSALAFRLTVAQASMSLNRKRQRSFLVIVPFC